MEVFIALLSLIILLGFFVSFIWLIVKVRALSQDVSILKMAVSQFREAGKPEQPNESMQSTLQENPAASKTPVEPEKGTPQKTTPPEHQASIYDVSEPVEQQSAATRFSLIEFLTSTRLMIWIGGLALALGGIFIVKYTIDKGMLGPWGKVITGLLIGLLMLGVSEWLRKQFVEQKSTQSRTYLPIAVAAAGFTTIYGAIYSAFAFYDLLSALPTVIMLALTAAAGLAYSILMGPLLALFALIGAYLVPIFVSTDSGSTELLYLYLTVIVGGSFLLLRYQNWNWIGAVNLIALLVWFVLWGAETGPVTDEIIVLSLHVVVVSSLYVFQFLKPKMRTEGPAGIFKLYRLTDTDDRLVYGTVIYALIVGVILTLRNEFALMSLGIPVAILLLTSWLVYRNPLQEGTIWIGQLGILVLAIVWPLEKTQDLTPVVNQLQVTVLVLISFYFVGHAFWRLRKEPDVSLPVLYAVYMPLLFFCILFWRYNGIGTSSEWGLVSLFLAAGYVAWASVQKSRNKEIRGYLALGASGGLSLAFSAFMSDEWLTIAFALLVFALSWINKNLSIKLLRPIAALLAIIVIVRLELDSDFVRTLIGAHFAVDWYLYGFGIPLLAFAGAWLWFSNCPANLSRNTP